MGSGQTIRRKQVCPQVQKTAIAHADVDSEPMTVALLPRQRRCRLTGVGQQSLIQRIGEAEGKAMRTLVASRATHRLDHEDGKDEALKKSLPRTAKALVATAFWTGEGCNPNLPHKLFGGHSALLRLHLESCSYVAMLKHRDTRVVPQTGYFCVGLRKVAEIVSARARVRFSARTGC